jgi:hypothetical protein
MPTAPRSIGGVLDDAIRLYRRALMPCFPIVLVAVLLLLVPSLLLSLRMQKLAAESPAEILALFTSPAIWLGYLGMMVFMCAVYGALFAQADAVAHGNRLTLGAAFGVGLKRAPTSIGVGLVFGVMIGLGMVLLIIPGIWLWGIFQFAFVPAIIERAGVFESFGISRRLVKGNWWRSNVIVFVAFVIMYVLIFMVSLISGVVAGVCAGVAGAGAVASSGITGALIFQQVISSILNLFMLSFIPCILLAVYYDLKLRREGGDLADRVGALNPAS